MIMRFVSGIIGIPLMILSLLVWNGTPFILAIGLLSLLGLNEFYRGVRRTGAEPQEWLGVGCVILFLFAARERFNPPVILIPGVLTFFIISSLSVELLKRDRAPIRNLGVTYLGVIYVGWLFSYLVALQSIPGKTQMKITGFEVPWGAWLVLFVVFAAWAADTGAYLIGRKWGYHKMTPVLSPGKSWEGAFAGITWSVAMCVVMGLLVSIPWVHILVLGVSIALVSLVGDLVESSLKRELGLKDFGSILPGHGGILDRFDGLFFAAPFFYYYITLVMKF